MYIRPRIVVANWKMHKDLEEGLALAARMIQMLHVPTKYPTQVILLPPFIHLSMLHKLLPTSGYVHLGAQNCHEQAFGAFTGEISPPMLRSVGAEFVLIGHSERRTYFREDNALLARKVSISLAYGLQPIFCCGESKKTREEGYQESFVNNQLAESLFGLSAAQIVKIIIAYEPVWAIGTGSTPTSAQVQAMHKSIRHTIAHQYGEEIAQRIPILYGGSCSPKNANSFFACPDVDGGLIGTASLEAEAFVSIINSWK